MASSQDTEITLGTGKLLALFFGLVIVCALFFGLGYSLGRKSDGSSAASNTTSVPSNAGNNAKASGGSPATAAQPMGFYKAVEQTSPNAELTPATETKADAPASLPSSTNDSAPASGAADPSTTIPTSGYFVQVAAVSKQEDAQALVDALKKKDYPAFISPSVSSDKLFRVQMGPFTDVKEAEAIRTKLIGDGYSPILKK